MANMANTLGLIFANMHDSTITDLTKKRTMGSVPVGARYRLIDFPLSNMVNSGITEVGVITKSNYQSLLDHLGAGDEWDLSRKNGGLHLLPPYNHAGGGLYRGRLEALAGVEDYIRHAACEYVVLSDCDIMANVDFKKVVDFHEKNKADITVVYGRNMCTEEQTTSKTVLGITDNNEVYDVLINPCIRGELNTSMNMFVMEKDFLMKLISETACRNLYNFEVDILQHRTKDFKIFGYKFLNQYLQIDSIQTYFNCNMALMDLELRKTLFATANPIYTKVRDEPPTKYGVDAKAKNCLVADGCIIEGEVENSVLFRGVKIGKGVVVRNCILMQDTYVGDKAEMNYVITDKNSHIGKFRSLAGTIDYPVFVAKGATV